MTAAAWQPLGVQTSTASGFILASISFQLVKTFGMPWVSRAHWRRSSRLSTAATSSTSGNFLSVRKWRSEIPPQPMRATRKFFSGVLFWEGGCEGLGGDAGGHGVAFR